MATYAIGDVQGCGRTLDALLARLRFDPARDQAWFAGDLVNRGTASLAVLRRIIGLGAAARAVLGNHDLHLLACAAGKPQKPGDTLDAILAAPDRDALITWLRRRPLAIQSGAWLMVHAGLDPRWSLSDTLIEAARIEGQLRSPGWRRIDLRDPAVACLTRLRLIDADGRPSFGFKGPPEAAPKGEAPWWTRSRLVAAGEITVLTGHWAAAGFRRGPGIVCLDSGCVWGRRLTALRLEDGVVFDVPADPADLPRGA